MTEDVKGALVSALEKPPAQSKKFLISLIGIGTVIFLVVICLLAMLKNPDIATSVASIASMALIAVGGLVSVCSGSQAAVEWNTTSALGKKEGQ